MDPFKVRQGWFELDFPSCFVMPGVQVSAVVRLNVERTIEKLRLNDYDHFVQARSDIVMEFVSGNITLAFLDRWQPFIAYEVRRQGESNVRARMKPKKSGVVS